MFRFNWFNITWTNTHAEEVTEEIEDLLLRFCWVAVIKPEDESFRKLSILSQSQSPVPSLTQTCGYTRDLHLYCSIL